VLLFEFLNRISFFSLLTWGFFLIAVVCALTVTNFHSARIRRYRSALIATATSSLLLGLITGALPHLMIRLGPDQSRLTPIDQLVTTEWIEPVSNPETEVVDEEIGFLRSIRYQFRYKLHFGFEARKILSAGDSTLVTLDARGNVHGFNAYTGLNHWQIRLHLNELLQVIPDQKRLYLLEKTSLQALRISCLDIRSPALLWQRTLPRSKEGSIVLDAREAKLLVSAGSSGIWALKSKSGELLWKRPELFSKSPTVALDRTNLVFEPAVAGMTGHWHFLNPHTGATLKKISHSHPDLAELIPVVPVQEIPASIPARVLARIDATNLLLLNPLDASVLWSHRSDTPIEKVVLLGQKQMLLLLDQNLIELRSLSENTLQWQKKIPLLPPPRVYASPDLSLFAGPFAGEGEPPGLAFYGLPSGDYLASGRESEPILDVFFYGDWLYLLSEHFFWAVRRGPA
jgi:hypothetical protein